MESDLRVGIDSTMCCTWICKLDLQAGIGFGDWNRFYLMHLILNAGMKSG